MGNEVQVDHASAAVVGRRAARVRHVAREQNHTVRPALHFPTIIEECYPIVVIHVEDRCRYSVIRVIRVESMNQLLARVCVEIRLDPY